MVICGILVRGFFFGWVHCDVKKIAGCMHWFFHLHVNKIISVITIIHTRHQRNNNGMYFFDLRFKYQNNLILSEIQFSMITRDQNGSCYIALIRTLCTTMRHYGTAVHCQILMNIRNLSCLWTMKKIQHTLASHLQSTTFYGVMNA